MEERRYVGCLNLITILVCHAYPFVTLFQEIEENGTTTACCESSNCFEYRGLSDAVFAGEQGHAAQPGKGKTFNSAKPLDCQIGKVKAAAGLFSGHFT